MTESIVRQIARLQKMPIEALRERWRDLFGNEPPAYCRSLLVRRLGYRLQELAHGGLDPQDRELIKNAVVDGKFAEAAPLKKNRPRQKDMPVTGTRLIREWNGGRYEVTVVNDGFEFQGKTYRSLTAITKVITGAHWNGPAFWGLRRNGDGRK
ncbi:MAG TPA: DUF2924 domain-containing protein [bacterium]|nr:DUF2924 domain-containing protein [bacterium]